MIVMNFLNGLDTKLFLLINGWHNRFFDSVMYRISDRFLWIPFFLILLLWIIKVYRKKAMLIILFAVVAYFVGAELVSWIIKPFFERLRPTYRPDLVNLIHLNAPNKGGLYGFVSTHATQCSALFTFLSLVLRKELKWLKTALLLWALMVCYSRIYDGVHYPGDVLGGIVVGFAIGLAFAKLYRWKVQKEQPAIQNLKNSIRKS